MTRRPRSTTIGTALVLGSVLLGCGSSSSTKDPSPLPAPSAGDRTTNEPRVYSRTRVEGDRVIVDVLARGAADIHGAAFRMHWDTTKLSFIEATGSHAWSREALHLAKEGAPGELAVAWTEKGQTTGHAAIDAHQDTRLGTITLRWLSRDGDPGGTTSLPATRPVVTFRADRSMLLDSKGGRIAVTWRDEPPAE